jgi:hypothetical protein
VQKKRFSKFVSWDKNYDIWKDMFKFKSKFLLW